MKKYLTNRIFKNEVLRSSIGLLIITFLVKALGYVEKLILAKYYGTGYEVDVYTVVITLVLSFFYFFREIIEPGFLRVFLTAKEKEPDDKEAWDIFNFGLRIILFVTVVVSTMAIIFPDYFVSIFAPGFSDEKFDLTSELIKIGIPAAIFLALSTLTNIILNAQKEFVLPASGEFFFKGAIVLLMVLLYDDYGIYGAVLGIVVGSIVRLIVHLTKLYSKISFKRTSIKTEYKKRLWVLTWPLLLGVGFSQLSSLVDNGFASYLQEGAIAALSYSKKIIELPVIIFPYILSIVVFPYFSQLAIEKNTEKLKSFFLECLKWIIILFLPLSFFFLVYSGSIVEIVFERGAFDAYSTALTAKPLMVYATGLVFFAIETVLVIFYYANEDTKTPVFVGIGCVILNMILTWVFVNIMGYTGVALAYVIQKSVKNLILLYLLKHKMTFNLKEQKKHLFKLVIATCIFGMIIIIGNQFLFPDFDTSLINKVGFIGVNFVVATIAFISFLLYTNVINPKEIRNGIRK
ncbi:murein biosynthesis integral membrane protein MurJ [Aquimarina pacifica]|uniref:murein biosynthesis integral membrane protein MurJ n=1 Tax=Aquimarina pacifica TaxID=1296415 RepID=UPI0004702465|nr:murein biosynthesis integral membrane protein MurJ [Aquimarina pacifica]